MQAEHDSSYLSRLLRKVETPTTSAGQMSNIISSIDFEAKLSKSGILEKRQYRNLVLIKRVYLDRSQI